MTSYPKLEEGTPSEHCRDDSSTSSQCCVVSTWELGSVVDDTKRRDELEKDVLLILQTMRSQVMATQKGASAKEEKCGECGTKLTRKSDSRDCSPKPFDPKKPFSCEFCRRTFVDRVRMQRHCANHLLKCPYRCHVCEKGFHSRSLLYHHKVNLHNYKRNVCDICGASFPYPISLKEHRDIHHTGERPFGCDQCGARFQRKASLKSHKKRHSGEKPFKCQFCEKTFVTAADRRKHERQHTGERPYACQFCGKKFAHSSHCRRHERNVCG